MEVKALVTAAVLLSFGALGCLLYALLAPTPWGRAYAAPGSRHQLVAEYDLSQAQLDVVFYPDPALPWKQALAPLRIPAVPLYHFVHGPPQVRLLSSLAAQKGGPALWDGDTIKMPGMQVFEDFQQQEATWIALTIRRNRKRNTTWTWQSTLPSAADAVEERCGIAVALQLGSLIAQVSGAGLMARGKISPQAKALHLAATFLEVAVTVAALSAFVCYLSRFHNKLHMLAAEFVFAQTDGAIVIWPADFRLKLGPCALSLALSGLFSLASSLLWVACLVGRSRPKAPGAVASASGRQRHRYRRSASSTVVAAEHLLEASVLKWRSHDRRVVAVVLLAMTLLALLLGLMAFLLGRAGVEDGVSKAFRGPEDGLRKTSRAAQAVSHAVARCVRTVVGGSARLVLGLVMHTASVAGKLGHFVALPALPIVGAFKWLILSAAKGVARVGSALARAAEAAAAAAEAKVPRPMPDDAPFVFRVFGRICGFFS